METERSLVGTLAYEAGPQAPDGEFPAVLGVMADDRLDSGLLVTGVIGLADVQEGFERLLDPGSERARILVERSRAAEDSYSGGRPASPVT